MSKEFRLYVRGILENESNEVLLVQKSENHTKSPGEWMFPGGSVEWGEEPEEALVRELYEETNLKVVESNTVGLHTTIEGDIHWLGIYFRVKVSNLSELKNSEPEKHSFLGFMSKGNFPDGVYCEDFI